MQYPVLVWRYGSDVRPSNWSSVANVLSLSYIREDELWVGTYNQERKGYIWTPLLELRLDAKKSTPTPALDADPVSEAKFQAVNEANTRHTAELEARIKKLQDAVEWLTASDKIHTESIDALGTWKTDTNRRIGELEKKAIIAAQLESRTEKGLLLLEGDIGRRTQKLSERLDKLESNTEMECAPWCTKQGHHTICSPCPQVWPPPTPGEPEVKHGWKIEKRDCQKDCLLANKHSHWSRSMIGATSLPMPCKPGCVYKGPHTGISCVVFE